MDQLQSLQSPADDASADPARVAELIRAIAAALRNHRLYGGESATLERFVVAVRERAREVWELEDEVKLTVEEHRFRWAGEVVYPSAGESGDLPFLFYKDGVRELTLLPGIENEILDFIGVIARASKVRSEEEDLVTLLWDADLACVKYEVVELATEGTEIGSGAEPPERVNVGAVRASAAAETTLDDRGFSADDFEDTLHFLDEAELRILAREVRKEAERDLWADILSALFDRLEEGDAARQVRIIGILTDLLPSMLGSGRLDRAASTLRDLVDLAARPRFLPADALRAVRSLLQQLSAPETIRQLVLTLEESPDTLRGDHLTVLLGFFPPQSLAPLMRALDSVTRPDVKRLLEDAVERLASANPETVVALLDDEDPSVVAGAARWVGWLQIGGAATKIAALLEIPDSDVRLAAIEAIQELRAATAGGALVDLIEDEEREVRVAAVRALVALGYVAARKPIAAAVTSKRLRAADRTEKLAFFEAYGRLAGADSVQVLDRTLNGKSWLGKTEPAELRACAAVALAQVRHPSARASLEAAAEDVDPVVRTAVGRALKGDPS